MEYQYDDDGNYEFAMITGMELQREVAKRIRKIMLKVADAGSEIELFERWLHLWCLDLIGSKVNNTFSIRCDCSYCEGTATGIIMGDQPFTCALAFLLHGKLVTKKGVYVPPLDVILDSMNDHNGLRVEFDFTCQECKEVVTAQIYNGIFQTDGYNYPLDNVFIRTKKKEE